MIRRTATLLLAALLVAALAGADSGVVPPDAAELSARVAELTAPEMEGRGSATPGGERAALAIARHLAAAGLRPVGDGATFFQSFVATRATRVAAASTLELVPSGRQVELGRGWQPHGGSISGEISGDVVFAGYGLSMPGRGWDDYASADVRDRVVVVLDGAPARLADARPGRLDKLVAARRQGARAVLVVTDSLPTPAATAARVAIASGAITPIEADALLAASGRSLADLAAAARERPTVVSAGARIRLRVDLVAADARAANVLAVLPGTDPTRAHEAIVVGAHYDHLGQVNGQVHPGADDNASGTAVVLGLARAFAAAGGAPRTLVFALFSGEELGLLGSAHYVRNPPWPVERTVAMVNFDMVGRLRDNRVTVGGVGSGDRLATVVREAGHGVPLDLELRQTPFAPSDHARFYAVGVPVLFFHTGTHDDYHRPSDTADKIDAAGMARVAAVGTRVVAALAAGPTPVFASVPRPPASAARVGTGAGEAFLGVVADFRSESDGVGLGGVVPGSAAARAGLRDGDVLVRIGDVGVNSFGELRQVVRARRPGEELAIVYLRDGDDHVTSATLDARP